MHINDATSIGWLLKLNTLFLINNKLQKSDIVMENGFGTFTCLHIVTLPGKERDLPELCNVTKNTSP